MAILTESAALYFVLSVNLGHTLECLVCISNQSCFADLVEHNGKITTCKPESNACYSMATGKYYFYIPNYNLGIQVQISKIDLGKLSGMLHRLQK